MKNKGTKIYLVIAVIIISAYAIIQAIFLFAKPLKTEKLVEFTADDFISSEGFIMRKETLIKTSNSGSPEYLVGEGEKVKKDSIIAVMYSGNDDVATKNKINDLEKKISQIENSLSTNDLFMSDALKLENMIEEKLMLIAKASGTKKTVLVSQYTNELQTLLNKKQIILGEVEGFDKKLKSLKQERDNLKENFSGQFANVSTPVAGFFSSEFDGYENLLEPEFLKKNGFSAFNEVLALKSGSNKPSNYIGKIIEDFKMYYACIMPFKQIRDYSVGDNFKIRFENSKGGEVNSSIWHMDESSQDVLVIFECDTANSQTNNLRKEKAQIITKNYKGYKVNKSAVRMIDNTTGIFVLVGVQIQFKPVKVLFSRDDYMIIVADSEKRGSLMTNEQVVVEGKELFDGKIVK